MYENNEPEEDYLTTKEAARILRISPSTLAKWRTKRRKCSPPSKKLPSGHVLYCRKEVIAWINKY